MNVSDARFEGSMRYPPARDRYAGHQIKMEISNAQNAPGRVGRIFRSHTDQIGNMRQ